MLRNWLNQAVEEDVHRVLWNQAIIDHLIAQNQGHVEAFTHRTCETGGIWYLWTLQAGRGGAKRGYRMPQLDGINRRCDV